MGYEMRQSVSFLVKLVVTLLFLKRGTFTQNCNTNIDNQPIFESPNINSANVSLSHREKQSNYLPVPRSDLINTIAIIYDHHQI